MCVCVNYGGVYYSHKVLIDSLMAVMLANEELLHTCCLALGITAATVQQEIISPAPALGSCLVPTSCGDLYSVSPCNLRQGQDLFLPSSQRGCGGVCSPFLPSKGRNGVKFLPSNWQSAVLWAGDEYKAGSTLIVQLLLSHDCVKPKTLQLLKPALPAGSGSAPAAGEGQSKDS